MANLRTYPRITFTSAKGTLNVSLDPKQASINSSILRVLTTKNLSDSTGTFSIDLAPRVLKTQTNSLKTTYLPDIIKPFNLVQIDFKTDKTSGGWNDDGYKTEMIGFVSRAAMKLAVDPRTGKPVRVFHIEGYDFTKALMNYTLYFNPFINTKNALTFNGALFCTTKQGREILASLNPAQFLLRFVNSFFTDLQGLNAVANQSPYYGFYFNPTFSSPVGNLLPQLQSGIKLDTLVDFSSGISTVFSQIQMTDPFILMDMGSGDSKSIWDILKSYSDSPYHEVFLDLRRANFPYQSWKNIGSTSATPSVDTKPTPLTVPAAEKTHTISNLATTNLEQNSTLQVDAKQPYVFYMRTSPFSQKDWAALNYHIFSTADVMTLDLATSDENIYNYFQVLCERENVGDADGQLSLINALSSEDQTTKPGLIPIFDQPSILTYGLKKFPADTTKYVDFVYSSIKGVPVTQPAFANFSAPIMGQATLARELFRWFSFGDDFETGVIVLKGRCGIDPSGATIGSKLVEVDPTTKQATGKEYYIESVSQNFELDKPFTTTLGVTRGHFPNDYFDYSVTPPQKIQGRFSKVSQREIALGIAQTVAPEGLFYDVPS